MQHLAVTIQMKDATEEKLEMLVALLNTLDYEGITENDDNVIAYVESDRFDRKELRDLLENAYEDFHASITEEKVMEEKNWNEEWEKNFSPVVIDHRVAIRAPFHESFDSMEYVINISPRMAFGTGHHETTSLMISAMLEMELNKRKVLDMGCGTGVLGIFASMLGASEVIGIDIDKWAYENAIENVAKNQVEMTVMQGSSDKIPEIEFDVILANINRNILIEQAADYDRALNYCGRLLVSGFLKEDIDMIEVTFEDLGFTSVNHTSMGKWQMLEFVK